MVEWWNSLDNILQALYCVAIPATLVLLLETVIAMAGGGHDVDISDTSGLDLDSDFSIGDMDFDIGSDVDIHADVSDLPSLRLFTVQGIVAFLCICSWTGIITYSTMPLGMSLGLGAVLGLIAMFVLAKVIQIISKLNQNGMVDFRNALGQTARVYLVIPKEGKGMGKVNVTIQGSMRECDAISRGEQIDTGAFVRIIDLEDDVLVVEKAEE